MSREVTNRQLIRSRLTHRSATARLVGSRLGALLVAAGLAALSATNAFADVLAVTPANSLAVAKIRNLDATSKKVADLSTKLGVAALSPEMADPLGSLLTRLNIKQGLNQNGEMGIVFLPAEQWAAKTPAGTEPADGDAKKPAVVLLLPVSDYKAFLGNFEGAKTDGDISEVTIEGQTQYVASWGDYAAMSEGRDFVAARGSGLTVNAAATKEFAEKDMVLWANVPALKAVLSPRLATEKTRAFEKIDEEAKNNPRQTRFAPVYKALAAQLFTAADTFLGDSAGATFSLNLSDAGINSTLASEFSSGSYLGKLTTALVPDSAATTAGLPAGSYLAFGGMSLKGETLLTLLNDFARPIIKELAAVDTANSAQVQSLLDSIDKMARGTRSNTIGVLAPKGALGAESIFQVVSVTKGDAKTYLEGFRSYSELSTKLVASLGAEAMPTTFEYKPASKTVAGVTFDSFSVLPPANPKTPEEAQAAQIMTLAYGPNGLTTVVGIVDDNTIVSGAGVSDESLTRLIASAKAGTDELGKLSHVQATAKQLPASSLATIYIALDELVKTGVSYARQFGAPVNLQLPDNLPPIGSAISAEGNVLRVDTHIPTELVQSLIAAYLQMQQGGGGGGGGGGNGL